MRSMGSPAGAGPGSSAVLKVLGAVSVATFFVVASFYFSSDLRSSLSAAAGSLGGSTELHRHKNANGSNASLAEAQTQHPVATSTVTVPAVRVITTVIDRNNNSLDILEEPIPEDCYAENHADYAGYAVQWGLGNKARSAAECCRMCKEYTAKGDVPHGCNIWVWCGDPSGVCWTMDIHHHTTGDCWLKYQASWDGIVDKKVSNLEINHRGKFTPEFRKEHKTAPEVIPWVAGLVSNKKGTQ